MKKLFLFIFSFLFLSFVKAQNNEDQNINLETLNITAKEDSKAKKLILEVIENRYKNSPKSLGNYEFKEYSKVYSNSDNTTPLPTTMNSVKDSIQLENWLRNENSMNFLLEKGVRHFFDKNMGEKIKTEAYRISGIQTPLVELAAIDPIPYELNDNKFNFFYFKTFINPISKYGMNFYDYRIKDTIQQNNLKLIRLNFKSLKDATTPLYGTILIDSKSKAVANFYAEYQTKGTIVDKGSLQITGFGKSQNYEMESKYKPYKDVWVPVSQSYNASFIRSTKKDSIEIPTKTFIKVEKYFKDFKTGVEFTSKDFKGYKNELPPSSFKNFEENIIPYRAKPLTNIEKNTYLYIDEEGKKENIDLIIKKARFLVNGFNFNLGKIDVMLPEIIGGNEYEGFRLGLGLKTNSFFSPQWGLNGRVNYGFRDKKLKYALGANYLINPGNNGILSVEYMDDVNPAGRFSPILRNGFNYMRNVAVNSKKYEFFGLKKYSISYDQDFYNNLSLKFGVHKAEEENLFIKELKAKTFKNTLFTLNSRWSPNNEYIKAPYGKYEIKSGYPHFFFDVAQASSLLNGDFDFTRLNFSAEHLFHFIPAETFVKFSAGTTLGKTPLWYTFNEGSHVNNNNSLFDLFSFGGSDTFETMPADAFYSTSYTSLLLRQKLFSINKKSEGGSAYLVMKTIYGDLNKQKTLFDNNKYSLNNWYNEAGIEFRKLLLNSIGLGFYYRFGAYNSGNFKEDFAIKTTIDLPFLDISF
ncbi:hypothetical protein KRX57_09000 [Weeksellaceae bacterium TAE3-ERU29]|nr:hypothetical protein [Weeksellaceae bacterium TAE3-ERU29]